MMGLCKILEEVTRSDTGALNVISDVLLSSIGSESS